MANESKTDGMTSHTRSIGRGTVETFATVVVVSDDVCPPAPVGTRMLSAADAGAGVTRYSTARTPPL